MATLLLLGLLTACGHQGATSRPTGQAAWEDARRAAEGAGAEAVDDTMADKRSSPEWLEDLRANAAERCRDLAYEELAGQPVGDPRSGRGG